MEKRQLPEDFKDFVQFLNLNDVEYLLIGGWAVSIYDLIINKRATGRDQDITDANKLEKLLDINKKEIFILQQTEG